MEILKDGGLFATVNEDQSSAAQVFDEMSRPKEEGNRSCKKGRRLKSVNGWLTGFAGSPKMTRYLMGD